MKALENLRTVLNQAIENILALSKEEGIEVEVRIGKVERDGDRARFNTNIGEEKYQHLLEVLSNQGAAEVSNIEEFKNEKGRFRFDQNNNLIESVIKNRIRVIDFDMPENNFDVRIGISREIKVEYDGSTSPNRIKKERYKFKGTLANIELTKVTIAKETSEEHSYQIEIELNMDAITMDQVEPAVKEVMNKLELLEQNSQIAAGV